MSIKTVVYSFISRLFGRNLVQTPPEVISLQLAERRPLPLGLTDFHEWSDRIISGAQIPGVDAKSQKFALAAMVMSMKPTEAFVDDGYFIQCLRKSAANQVCAYYMEEFRNEAKTRLAMEDVARAAAMPVPSPVIVPQAQNVTTGPILSVAPQPAEVPAGTSVKVQAQDLSRGRGN
jgi:hypothetical protein